MRCLTCHYNLGHLPEHRCPECGRAFDPNDPNTLYSPTRVPVLRILLMVGIILAIILVCIIWWWFAVVVPGINC